VPTGAAPASLIPVVAVVFHLRCARCLNKRILLLLLDIRKFVFGKRVTNKWNDLPHCCINCTTLNNLNRIFIRYWNRKPSKKL